MRRTLIAPLESLFKRSNLLLIRFNHIKLFRSLQQKRSLLSLIKLKFCISKVYKTRFRNRKELKVPIVGIREVSALEPLITKSINDY